MGVYNASGFGGNGCHGRGAVTTNGSEIEYPEVVGLYDVFVQHHHNELLNSESYRRDIPVGRGKPR